MPHSLLVSFLFEPDDNFEEGEVKILRDKMMKNPVKIATNGNKSRSNVTCFEIKGICHFDNNVKQVLEMFVDFNKRVVRPNCMTDGKEECKKALKLLHLLYMTGTAT